MFTLNILARGFAAVLIGYVACRFVPAFGLAEGLVIGQFCFLASLLVIPAPWIRIMRPIDLEKLLQEIPESEMTITCEKSSTSNECVVHIGRKHSTYLALESVNKRSKRRCREFEEELFKEIPAPALLLVLALMIAVFKSKYPATFATIGGIQPILEVIEVAPMVAVFTFFCGRLYGELAVERKINSDVAETH